MKILLVEDGAGVELIRLYRILEDRGFEVQSVRGSFNAGMISLIQDAQLEGILVGTSNPGVTGLAICRKIKTEAKLKEIPLFMVSFVPTSIPVQEVGEVGVQRLFTPPLNLNTVANAVSDAVAGKGAKGTVRESVQTALAASPASGEVSMPSEGVIRGTVGELVLPLKEKGWTGTVHLSSSQGQGSLRFKEGEVMEALKNGAQDEQTLMELIKWDNGTYRLEDAADASTVLTEEEPDEESSPESVLDVVLGLKGVLEVIKVASDGATLASRELGEGKSVVRRAGVAFCGNAAETIGQVWNLGNFLHGAIIGKGCKLLLHPYGEDFLGTNIGTGSSAAHIGAEIEGILKRGKEKS